MFFVIGWKIEDMIIQSRLWGFGHVMRGDVNTQIREVMELGITEKRKWVNQGNRGKTA